MAGQDKNDFFGYSLTRHRAFYERAEMDRPLLAINLGFFAHEHFPRTMNALPKGLIRPEDVLADAFLADCEDLYHRHRQIGDDYPFVASPIMFIPWMEAIMDCPVMASPTSVWAESCVSDWQQYHWCKPRLDDPWPSRLLKLMGELVKFAAGRFPVSPTMMRGPADMLAAMRGASEFALDFIDNAETMKKAMDLVTQTWIELARAQHALIPESQNGYMDGDRGFRFWGPQKALWLQEDAMALLSPKIYRDFILPADRRIAAEFGSVAFHLHDTGLFGLDDLSSVEDLDVIELNFESAVSDVEAVFRGWSRIQKYKPLIIWRNFAPDFEAWLERVLDEFTPRGLSLQITVKSLEDAVRVREIFMNKTKGNR
jgi:hypothetical protein